METIRISGNTHAGRRRAANQDACIFRQLWGGDKALAAVIDGVGGYAGGERAAAIAKDSIEQYMHAPSGDTLTMLREALIFANNQVAAERKKDQRFSEMCCVLTALVADATTQNIYFVHVGDTRLYRYRNGKLQKLTRDHSFVGIREDAGEISEEEAMAHPHRNQILREVGSAIHRLDDEDFMDYGSDTLLPGDLLLLCSDGLTDMITAQQLSTVLAGRQSLLNKTNRLIELANAAGGHDNITVVLLQYPTPAIAVKNVTGNDTIVVTNQPVPLQTKTSSPKNRQWAKIILLPALLSLILVAAAGWWLSHPKNNLVPVASQIISTQVADSLQPDSIFIKNGGRSSDPAIQGPGTLEKMDTLRLSATQNFADLKKLTDSTGHTLVLLPQQLQHNNFSAISITGRSASAGDTLEVSNLRIVGFETGIDLHLPVSLKAVNLVFENTPHPIRYLFTPNQQHTTIFFMNTAKQ